MKPLTKQPILIFTDLDGTLLDHQTYRYGDAVKALNELEKRQIPIIISSSKTLAEIIPLRKELRNDHPFIAENGSVIGIPTGYFPLLINDPVDQKKISNLMIDCPGGDRNSLLKILSRIRKENQFQFTGFNDMSVETLSKNTGLSHDQAKLAKQRLSTEPIIWQDTSANWQKFVCLITSEGLAWVQGGRFISISRPFDKKDGIKKIMDLYNADLHSHCITIGLGDSPNDQGMLDLMDTAVIIRSERSRLIQLTRPETILRTTLKGPKGWQEAMDILLSRHFNQT